MADEKTLNMQKINLTRATAMLEVASRAIVEAIKDMPLSAERSVLINASKDIDAVIFDLLTKLGD